ncbi:MAG: O-antigen ligase family protein [Thermosynechococcaceae cyanobacterium]
MTLQEVLIESKDYSDKKAWLVLSFFSVSVLFLSTIALSRYTLILIPVLAFLTGLYLYFRSPILYVSFSFWMHFVSSEVQRFVDYRLGTFNSGYLVFTSNLVMLIAAITFFKNIAKVSIKESLPFNLVLFASFYSVFISLIKSPPQDFLLVDQVPGLVGPIFFGFHCYCNWKYYAGYKKILESTFMWGAIVLGIYGIIQFIFAPSWDRHWLNATKKWSYGIPEPFGIRVWSGTSSFQVFAITCFIALLILLYKSDWFLRFPGIGVITLGILLTQARAAWISGVIACVIFLSRLKSKAQIRIIVIVLCLTIVITFIVLSNPILYELVLSRLGSLTETNNDLSLNIRKDFYRTYLDTALSQIIGIGLAGSIDLSGFILSDAPLFIYMFYFGWIGIIPYFLGILLLVFRLCSFHTIAVDNFFLVSKALAIGLVSMIGFNNILMGTLGFYLWGFIGLSLAGLKYDRYISNLKAQY